MADLTENGAAWDAGIYQIERTDAVDAGTGGNGIANLQALKLANRTAFLKIHMDALEVLRDRGPIVRSVIALVADTTLVRATHMGTLIEGSQCEIVMPVTAGMVEGDIFHFRAGSSACTIYSNTSQTIPDAILYGNAANTIGLNPGEQLELVWKSSVWSVKSFSQFTISSPIGTVAAFASTNVPKGWVKCNGASLNRTTYARLFANIGVLYGSASGSTFYVPDLRGEFIRGLDDGRGIDTGRAIGSAQSDALKAHTHTVAGNLVADVVAGAGYNVRRSNTSGTETSSSTGGTETRPRNVAMMYCIKY